MGQKYISTKPDKLVSYTETDSVINNWQGLTDLELESCISQAYNFGRGDLQTAVTEANRRGWSVVLPGVHETLTGEKVYCGKIVFAK